MFKERLWRVTAGFVLVAVLLLPASSTFAGGVRAGVDCSLQSLWRAWAGLMSTFRLAKGPASDDGDKGTAIDPNGFTGKPGVEKGPRVEPYGAASGAEEDKGPAIDPYG